MRILIAEEALQAAKGHWPSYIGGIADELRLAGDEVEILMHRDAEQELVHRLEGAPWLTQNCWLDPASQGALGGIRHNLRFCRELSTWLREHQPYDWVCALTMRLQHLLAFALLARSGKIPKSTQFLLLFVQGFGKYAGPGKPTTFPKTPSIRLARFCFQLLAQVVREKKVMLAAETNGMQDELQRFTSLPVSLFPHPVPALPVGCSTNIGPRTNNQQQTITITCPGFARHEKGTDLLQEAVKALLALPEGNQIRFVIQWPETFKMPDGRLLGPDPALVADARVEFLNHNLETDAYEALLARTSLVVLPYRRKSYHHRVSRVAIEAACRSIPLIYTSGTWSGEVAALAGGGVEIPDETSDALITAIREAVQGLSGLQESASKGARKVSAFHSALHFRQILFENSPSTHRAIS